MRLPSLSTRPFLNTRPVWIFTGAAVLFGLILMAVNIGLYMSSNTRLEQELERKKELQAQVRDIQAELQRDIDAIAKVPWKRLRTKVEGLNGILRAYGFSWQRLLRDVGGVLPRQVRLERINPAVTKEGLSLSLKGKAQTRDAMLELLQNMIDDPRFERPLPRSETTPEESGVGYEFALQVLYHPDLRQSPGEEKR